jgi:hypothetical protein
MTVEMGSVSAAGAGAVSAGEPAPVAGAAQGSGPEQILAERWPMLVRAMGRYQQNLAEDFTRQAYDCIQAGVIRLEDRRQLAAYAAEVGIRDFDAQLLIACAVRQWALDRRYDASPRRDAPQLSFEYRSWSRAWVRFGIIVGAALGIDLVVIMRWLS